MLPHLGALGRHLVANVAQHRPNIKQTAQSWSQHRPKQSPRCLNNPIQPPQNLQKPLKNIRFFKSFLISSASTKMLQKNFQNSAKASQNEPNMAILALTWPILGATCCQLGSILAQLRPNVSKQVFQNRTIPPQDAPRRAKTPQNASRHRFSSIFDPSGPRFSAIFHQSSIDFSVFST